MRESHESAPTHRDLQLVIDSIPVMAWIVLPDGTLDFINRQWLDYSGLSMDVVVGNPTGTVHPDDVAGTMERWRENGLARAQPYQQEIRLRGADGYYRWFLVRTVPQFDESGRLVRWYGTATDIEDRKRAEEIIRINAQKLQALTRRLVEIQEADRRDFSRELHDKVGQTLTAILINMDRIRRRPATSEDPEIRAAVDDCFGLIESAFGAVKDVMYELRPPMLDEHGLVGPLQWYARKFSDRSGIVVEVIARDDWRCDARVELALFRITQEGLANVARHAKATHVTIEVTPGAGKVTLTLQDDGVGLRPGDTAASSQPGYGLITMRERAESVGGSVKMSSGQNGGTRLTVTVPLDRDVLPGEPPRH
jgi:two-component system, NarL family, sensor histidine kinase UhpB